MSISLVHDLVSKNVNSTFLSGKYYHNNVREDFGIIGESGVKMDEMGGLGSGAIGVN